MRDTDFDALYRFATGVTGYGHWDFVTNTDREVNEFVAIDGRLRFSTTRDVPIKCWRGDARKLILSPTHRTCTSR
jgi:hypothetical protein